MDINKKIWIEKYQNYDHEYNDLFHIKLFADFFNFLQVTKIIYCIIDFCKVLFVQTGVGVEVTPIKYCILSGIP